MSGHTNPFSPSQFISVYVLLLLYTQNKLFGNENKANDHILSQHFISKMRNKILPSCLQGNYCDSLGEFSNTSHMHGMFGAERMFKS